MEMNLELVVEKAVQRELEGIDLNDIITAKVRLMIEKGVGNEIVAQIREHAKVMIQDAIQRELDGPVSTDDGWGKKESFGSFEDLFRRELKKAMDAKYEVRQTLEKLVKARVDSLIKQDYNRVLEKITDEITKSRIKKEGAA